MLKSMTGFGRAEQTVNDKTFLVEIKSLNGKQLEMNLKIPPLLKTYEFDVSNLKPQIAAPESPDNVSDITKHLGKKIDYAFIGTCGNGRLEDLHEAANILKGNQIKNGVRFVIAPASKNVLIAAIEDGTAAILLSAGATFINSGCGPCVGTHEGVPADGEVVISSANRNFRGRMGNPNSEIYLASPATVAASALMGEITAPLPPQRGSLIRNLIHLS